MSGSDYLQPLQFYHATKARNLDSIKESGLTASSYSPDNPVLTSDHSLATMYARGNMINGGEQPGIVTLHVPSDKASEYLHADSTAHKSHGNSAFGLRKPLPPEMVHSTEALKDQGV